MSLLYKLVYIYGSRTKVKATNVHSVSCVFIVYYVPLFHYEGKDMKCQAKGLSVPHSNNANCHPVVFVNQYLFSPSE